MSDIFYGLRESDFSHQKKIAMMIQVLIQIHLLIVLLE